MYKQEFFKFRYGIKAAFLCLSVFAFHVQFLKAQEFTKYVNPFIGTGGHGHTFPGATRPFGMVQLSPDTFNEGWDWVSGYHASDRSIMGFSHTHLSGTGRGDLLDIMVMPGTGPIQLFPGDKQKTKGGYRSGFDKKTEKASPGYYAVFLEDYKILAELTTSKRVGFHRYTFPKSDQSHVLFDLFHGFKNDSVLLTGIQLKNNSLITGFRKSKGWAEGKEKDFANEHIFFAARFSKPFNSSVIAKNGLRMAGNDAVTGKDLKVVLNFNTKAQEAILIKVGISYVSEQAALANLDAEIHDWDFDRVKREAEKEWDDALKVIEVKDQGESNKTVFYTALYHTMIAPYLYSDADGKYRGFDDKIHTAKDFDQYTVFSLWDTFRAAHPLFTITRPEKVNHFIKSMLSQYQESGLLPVWPLVGSETNCMIGYHAIPVITDAYFKGFRSYDVNLAYKAIKASAMQDQFGIQYLKKFNYVPTDLENKSVSKTLEYAYDDWCIAQLAKALGKTSDYAYFSKRAKAYANVFDPKTGFMRGKKADGTFNPGFDPSFASYGYSDFIEGNSWQYSWFVPHDVQGLIHLMGGKDKFTQKLDELFVQKSNSNHDKPIDITGLIGEYAHGNEPSHHVAYLYNEVGQPWKTQEKVQEICNRFYTNQPDGLSGNEDCGQMSAWYVFSAMGFYPVNPADGKYSLGVPLFKALNVKLGNKTFKIKAPALSPVNRYVQAVRLNGKLIDRSWINHQEIKDGAELEFVMGPGINAKSSR
ncbi:glycoside hydrolase family 92 protein [Pedobacter hiemivivus]|uniref:Glycoside hydrolase family 92 protein n=1 Tax=Pedobacter hiemivivus TaxID=2530454 RepID=A0A4U1GPG4_9SPHI|nr:GH92 family glycosyl hydrolase [Pedobacter hiemivivus]TKC63642.1 glycoside hydrolase family 92 protein [Pedobacter hiemivivus]